MGVVAFWDRAVDKEMIMTSRYSAKTEVKNKSDSEIERETAKKWAARAIACYEEYHSTNSLKWLLRADNYRHEALEHASIVGDRGRLVGQLQKEIDLIKKKKLGS